MDPLVPIPSLETVTALRSAQTASPDDAHLVEEDVVRAFLPLARRLAGRYVRPGVDADDLAQVANLALIKAIRRFDAEQGPFEPFAKATISGELKRHLRDQCWSIRPPRRVQELHSQIARTTESLAQRTHRTPSTQALARAMDAGVSEIGEALAARSCFAPSSLDHPIGPGRGTLGDVLSDGTAPLDSLEDSIWLDQICQGLCDADRELLRLRFFEGRTQREIATVMGVSQMRVSRQLTRLLGTLRLMAGSEVA